MKNRIGLYIIISMLLSGCSTSLDAGWRAFQSGNYEKAQQIAALNMAQKPMDYEVYALSSQVDVAQGRIDEGIRAAQFSVSLNETSATASLTLQKAYAAKSDWSNLCAEVDRARQAGALTPDERTHFSAYHEASQELLTQGKADAYPCYEMLAQANAAQDLPDPTASRRAFAARLAAQGHYERATQVLSQSDNLEDSLIETAKFDYIRHLRPSAQTKVRSYAEASPANVHLAAETAFAANDFDLAEELYSIEDSSNNIFNHGITKLRIGKKDEARTIFSNWFTQTHSAEERKQAVRTLTEFGFSEIAAEGCEKQKDTLKDRFEIAEVFLALGQISYAKRIVESSAENSKDDQKSCILASNWNSDHKFFAEAVRWAERAKELGSVDRAFELKLLKLYSTTREFDTLQKSAQSYIDAEPSLRAQSQCEIAEIYASISDHSRAAEMLAASLKSAPLSPVCETLYVNSLAKTQQFETLYRYLEPQTASGQLTHIALAKRFNENAASEKEFYAALSPCLQDGNPDQYEALFMSAEYAYDVIQNETKGDAEFEKILASYANETAYERIVNNYRRYKAPQKALEITKKWQNAYASPNSYLNEARIYLADNDFDACMKAYDIYVEKENLKPDAISKVISDFSQSSDDDVGFEWFSHLMSTHDVSSNTELETIKGKLYTSQAKRIAATDKARSERLRQEGLEAYVRAIETSDGEQNCVRLGNDLQNNVKSPETAILAFEKSKSSKHYNDNAKLSHLYACIETHCSDTAIKNILGSMTEKANWSLIRTALRDARRIELAEDHFVQDLSSSNYEKRSTALTELISLYMEKGESNKIRSVLKKYEDAQPNNTQARTLLARQAIRLGYADEAIKQLTWLQMTVPNARENLELGYKLSQSMPDNTAVQTLWNSQLSAAQTQYHRIIWLGDLYEKSGLPKKAIEAYEMALAVSDTNPETIYFNLLNLAIQVSDQQRIQTYTDKLKKTTLWNAERLYTLSTSYEKANDLQEAQNMLALALQLEPGNPSYKLQKLSEALKTRNSGLITLTLNQALEPTTANVSDLLIQNNAWLDVFDAIETYAGQGNYELASAMLMQAKTPYILTYGSASYINKLREFAQNATYTADSANEDLAITALESNASTDLEGVVHGELWAKYLLLNPALFQGTLNKISDLRNTLSAEKREAFDREAYHTLLVGETEPYPLSSRYAERFFSERTDSDQLKDALIKANITDALRRFATNTYDNVTTIDTIVELSTRGYIQEALDEAKRSFVTLDEAFAPLGALILAILGDESDSTYKALKQLNGAQIVSIPPETLALTLNAELIKAWLASLPETAMNSIYEAAMLRALQHPSEADELHQLIQESIQNHVQKSTLWLSYSRYAKTYGFTTQALLALQKASAILPDSQLIYYSMGSCLDALNQTEEAKAAYLKGETVTDNVAVYWKEARNASQTASPAIRAFIAQKQLDIFPNDVSAKLDLISANLASSTPDVASTLANELFTATDITRAENVIAVYDDRNYIQNIPKIYAENESFASVLLKARTAYYATQYSDAARLWDQAASRSLWPYAIYTEGLTRLASQKEALPALEQLAQLTATSLPFAPDGDLFLAISYAKQNEFDKALNALLSASKKSKDSAKTEAILLSYLDTEAQINAMLKGIVHPKYAAAQTASLTKNRISELSPDEARLHLELIDRFAKGETMTADDATAMSKLAEKSGNKERALELRRIAALLQFIGR